MSLIFIKDNTSNVSIHAYAYPQSSPFIELTGNKTLFYFSSNLTVELTDEELTKVKDKTDTFFK